MVNVIPGNPDENLGTNRDVIFVDLASTSKARIGKKVPGITWILPIIPIWSIIIFSLPIVGV